MVTGGSSRPPGRAGDQDGAGDPPLTATPPAPRPLDEPHPSRLAPDHPRRAEILAAHRAAMAAGEQGYLDPETGLFVLCATTLLERGTCCDRGCRHCPYVV